MSRSRATGREALLERAVQHFAHNGVKNTTLRALAEEISTSHRMLNYHFGSREGLLSAVVDLIEEGGRETLARIAEETGPDDDPVEAALRFWHLITDEALVYGPLLFELSSHAMLGLPHATGLRERLVTTWLDAIEAMYDSRGVDPLTRRTQARLDLAVARGLLHDLLLTRDRDGVDAAMHRYVEGMVAPVYAGAISQQRSEG